MSEAGREQYFNPAAPVKTGSDGTICGVQRKSWPYKICNAPYRHDGEHYCEEQHGTKITRLYWRSDE